MIDIILCMLALCIYMYMLVHVYKCEKDIDCISDIAYDKHTKLFPICMILMSLFLFIGMFLHTPYWYKWLCMLPNISMIGVSLFPYKDGKTKYRIHYTFALISFISAFVIWTLSGYWFVPFLFCLASLRKKWLLGLEMGLIGSSFLYILL